MYNPNEDKRENENNMEPIHGHVENEHEEKVLNENEYSENTKMWNRMQQRMRKQKK